MFGSGWVNDCGNELFTLGWVTCEQALETLTQDYGGRQFNSNYLVFQPVIKKVSESIPVNPAIVATNEELNINLDQFEFSVGDEVYGLQVDGPAEQILNGLPEDIEQILDKAVTRVSVPREKVKQKLLQEVEKQLQVMRDFKTVVFRDDEEIIEILFMADEL